MSYTNKTYPAGTRVRCASDEPWRKNTLGGPQIGDTYALEAGYSPGDKYLVLAGFTGRWSARAFEVVEPVQLGRQAPPAVDYRAFGSRSEQALKAPVKDNVNLPEHYARFKIEPVRFCMENEMDPFQFNIIKYTCRHDSKNGIEDIDKVIRYATMYRKFLLGDADWWKA